MQLHQLKPTHKLKKRKRIGRGGKRGTYCGRGMKGQKSRAGARIRPAIRDLIKKIPKLRGTGFKKLKKKSEVVNVGDLEKKFPEGEKINPQLLQDRGLIRKIKGKLPPVKLLGKGKIQKKLEVSGLRASKSAIEKIKKAGGKIICG